MTPNVPSDHVASAIRSVAKGIVQATRAHKSKPTPGTLRALMALDEARVALMGEVGK